MLYQWDKKKALSNLKKHGVAFADAVTVFADDTALTIPDNDSDEDRFVTMGLDALGRVLVVVYTWRGETIRIFQPAMRNKRIRISP